MNLGPIIQLFYEPDDAGVRACNKCKHYVHNIHSWIWTHSVYCNNGSNMRASNNLFMWFSKHPTKHLGGSINAIAAEEKYIESKYPQIAFLDCKMDLSELLSAVGDNISSDDKYWGGGVGYYYYMGKKCYPIIDLVIKNQLYKCLSPNCAKEYDCFPSIEMIAAHYSLHASHGAAPQGSLREPLLGSPCTDPANHKENINN